MNAFLFRREGFEPAEGEPANITAYQGEGTLEEAEHHLYSIVTEVNIVHLAITLLSLFVVFFGLFSGFVKERLYIGEAIIATGFGIAFSGYAAGIFAPRTWSDGHHFDEITLELTRAIIALSVFAVGVELPRAYVWRHWKSLTMLLGPVMLLGWMVSAALMYAIIPGLEFLPALVIAAGVTPTDPILASSVVGKGKFAQEHVPAHIRHILQAESGCNDGAAFPFLYIALFLLLRGSHNVGEAIGWWVLYVLMYQIILGIIIGAVVGILARKLLKFSKRRELIDRESMVAMYVALALLVTGLTTLAGSDDLLAAFACGTAFAWDDWFTESIEESNFSSTIDLLANCAIFIYLGATMPFASWQSDITTLTVWRLVLISAGIIAFRRLPTIYALQWWIPDIKTKREALFAGHFGPMGVGAIFISTLAAAKLPTPTVPPVTQLDLLALLVQPVTYFIVLSSILVHGLTISFFTLGRRVHSRVTSITRTFTAASRDAQGEYEEPAWMSRVKRARAGEDIVINRDDDGVSGTEKPMLQNGGESVAGAEMKAESEKGDMGTLAMFGAPPKRGETVSGSGSGSGSGTGSDTLGSLEEAEAGVKRREGERADEEEDEFELSPAARRPSFANRRVRTRYAMEREADEDPPYNVLADHPNRIEHQDYEGQYPEAHQTHQKHHHHQADEEAAVEGTRSRSSASKPELLTAASGASRPRSSSDAPSRDSAKEAKYCKHDQIQTWQEGRKIIIDRNDGTDVEIIDLDASPEDACRAEKNPLRRVLTIEPGEIERELSAVPRSTEQTAQQHEESAINRITHRMLKLSGATLLMKDDNLSAEEKERRRREKLKKDAWCRKEQKFRDTTDREWLEGDKVIIEHFDGSVDVRELTDDEKRARAARHLAALKALGSPIESIENELTKLRLGRKPSKESVKGKSSAEQQPVASTSRPTASPRLDRSDSSSPARVTRSGVALERTDRIEPTSDDDDEGDNRQPVTRLPSTRLTTGSSSATQGPNPRDSSPARPSGPARTNSALQTMRSMFGRSSSQSRTQDKPVRDRNEKGWTTGQGDVDEDPSAEQAASEAVEEQPATVAQGPGQSIRFADVDRPTREGVTGTGRTAPSLGSSLSMRRTGTGDSRRSFK